MTPEREAVARIVRDARLACSSEKIADRIIAEHIAPLRSALATAERERDELREQNAATFRDAVVRSCDEALQRYKHEARAAEARAASLEGLLAEAGKALGKIASADALSGVRALVAGWNGEDRPEPYERHPPQRGANLPKTTCGAVYELDEALTAARSLLTRIEAREGGEEMGRG